MKLSDSVEVLPQVGDVRARKLEKLGLHTAGDFLTWYPRSYEDRRLHLSIGDAAVGQSCCVTATVSESPRLSHSRNGLDFVKVRVFDETQSLELTFFNQSYVRSALVQGSEYTFYGTIDGSPTRKTMVNPVFEKPGLNRVSGCIFPTYPLTAGISSWLIAGCVRRVLSACWDEICDPLPPSLRQEHGLMELRDAYQSIHFPEGDADLEGAKKRLVFEELFYLSTGLSQLKGRRAQAVGPKCGDASLEDYYATLPFQLTRAQRRVAEECAADLRSGVPMNRLIQGDVGSGKTVVSAAAVWLAAKSGYQCALMAPTEILAEQHLRTLSPLLERSGLRVGLLTGSMTAKQKRNVYEELQLGMLDLVIGTHALLSEGVIFRRLGLVITDEQHRFGVNQRAALTAKGGETTPHVLVMSATPIPRTLALIIYGDLDVSVIDQLPPGRQVIDTFRVHTDKRQRMYGFVRKQAAEGHQIYIVCPAVEENPEKQAANAAYGGVDLKAVTEYTADLQKNVFPDLRVDFVHGKMKPKAKDAVMARFAAGELDILVSTTVIEVGVDVPNANLMIIENAERFGLSQLHQLRGRVGRGDAKSYCVLVSDSRSEDTAQRLKTMCTTNDGFRISEEDLKLRGPGDFFGARQHGLPQLKVADLSGDMRVLQEAQEAARVLLNDDPQLQKPEHQSIRARVKCLFAENPDIFN